MAGRSGPELVIAGWRWRRVGVGVLAVMGAQAGREGVVVHALDLARHQADGEAEFVPEGAIAGFGGTAPPCPAQASPGLTSSPSVSGSA